MTQKPSFAFIAASWAAFGTGIIGYFAGLFRSELYLSEKGYYFTVIMFGLFSEHDNGEVVSFFAQVKSEHDNGEVVSFFAQVKFAAEKDTTSPLSCSDFSL